MKKKFKIIKSQPTNNIEIIENNEMIEKNEKKIDENIYNDEEILNSDDEEEEFDDDNKENYLFEKDLLDENDDYDEIDIVENIVKPDLSKNSITLSNNLNSELIKEDYDYKYLNI